MSRVTRRKFLKVSGAGALAAKTGGMAAILATGQAPAYAQATTRALAPLERFRAGFRPAAAQGDTARGREGARLQDQPGDGQRQRPAAAHHGGDPVGVRPRPHHAVQQPPAALCREPRGHERCRGGDQQGRWRLLSPRQVELERRQDVDFHAVDHRRRHDRLSQVVVRGGRRELVPRHLGEISRGRQEAQGQGPAHRSDARPHLRRCADVQLPLDVVVRRQGGRRKRQGGHQQQGDHRLRQVHDRLLEGRARRGRPCLGRHQQQPRVPLADHLGDAQRRLDLHRVAAQPRQVHHREGRAS